ncbi:hypothetical protein [Burkholderia sp. Bp9012]|uniref:hypothetical protein n=1 Tax=Burkholderia sp. Bp9012 TaxID=2184562 RepID=UPI0021AB699D|nr:hypothetical protein [Burkholderia sp. Bp9012]
MFAATPAASTRQRWAGPRAACAGEGEGGEARQEVSMATGPVLEIDIVSVAIYIHPENRKVFDESFDKTG